MSGHPPPLQRSISNRVSFVALSVHERSIRTPVFATVTRSLGARGGGGGGGGGPALIKPLYSRWSWPGSGGGGLYPYGSFHVIFPGVALSFSAASTCAGAAWG